MTDDRRDRYRAAIRETDDWVLDDGRHMIDAVMAVADSEQRVVLGEQADEYMDSLHKLTDVIERQEAENARLRTELTQLKHAAKIITDNRWYERLGQEEDTIKRLRKELEDQRAAKQTAADTADRYSLRVRMVGAPATPETVHAARTGLVPGQYRTACNCGVEGSHSWMPDSSKITCDDCDYSLRGDDTCG